MKEKGEGGKEDDKNYRLNNYYMRMHRCRKIILLGEAHIILQARQTLCVKMQ